MKFKSFEIAGGPVEIPEHLKKYLSDYGPCVFDGWCGKPIRWGYEFIRYVPTDAEYEEISKYGVIDIIYPSKSKSLITKILTKDEAIKLYGEVTEIERGPRGGFRTMTFGTTKFCHELE